MHARKWYVATTHRSHIFYTFYIATYGGHLELSAFAHLTRRNVKVIQPGLVYVIEWAGGGNSSPTSPTAPSLVIPDHSDDQSLDGRERRRLRRERRAEKKEAKEKEVIDVDADEDRGTIYVA